MKEQFYLTVIQDEYNFSLSPYKESLLFEGVHVVKKLRPKGRSQPGDSFGPIQERKNHKQARIQLFLLMGSSQAHYWLTYPRFIEDWEYELTWEDQRKRFFTFEAHKFDSNSFGVNWGHAFAGALYYNCARASNLSLWESFLQSFVSSLYWEYVVEWREVVSISDNVFTIFGGLSCGEPWYQLGKHFAARSGIVHQILGFLNPFTKFNQWREGKKEDFIRQEPESGWHEFHVSFGRRNAQSLSERHNDENFSGGFRSEIISHSEYGKPGLSSETVYETLSSEINFEFSLGQRGAEELDFFSRAVLLGYFKQDIDEVFNGYSYYLGLGSAFTMFKKKPVAFNDSGKVKVKSGNGLKVEEPRDFRDKFSIIHIAGPVVDFTSFSGKSKLRMILEAYPDFAVINSFALNRYSKDHDISGVKTTLLHYGYYFGIGATLSSYLAYSYGSFELSGLLKYQFHESIDGRDRFQDELTDDFSLQDSRWKCRLSLGFKIPGMPFKLQAYLERIMRSGRIKEVLETELETRHFVGLNWAF